MNEDVDNKLIPYLCTCHLLFISHLDVCCRECGESTMPAIEPPVTMKSGPRQFWLSVKCTTSTHKCSVSLSLSLSNTGTQCVGTKFVLAAPHCRSQCWYLVGPVSMTWAEPAGWANTEVNPQHSANACGPDKTYAPCHSHMLINENILYWSGITACCNLGRHNSLPGRPHSKD